MSDLVNALNNLTSGFAERFENQRRNIGAAHQVRNDINNLSKRGIVAIKNEDMAEIERCARSMKALWDKLGELDLPRDVAWEFDSSAGQEIIEFLFCEKLYPKIIYNASIPSPELKDLTFEKLPKPEDWKISGPAYLAGVGDAIGELSKMVMDFLLREDLKGDIYKEARIEIRKRFLSVTNEMYEFLDQFENCYGMCIDNSRRRGYGNTYRGLLGRARNIIERQKAAFLEIKERS